VLFQIPRCFIVSLKATKIGRVEYMEDNYMTGIYYADLLQINGFGCLIMGYGKTKACASLLKYSAKPTCFSILQRFHQVKMSYLPLLVIICVFLARFMINH